MKQALCQLLLLLAAVSMLTARADIIIAPQATKAFPKQAVTIRALSSTMYPLGNFNQGDVLAVQVEVLNDVYKDLSAYFVDAANLTLQQKNLPFRPLQGVTKKNAPFSVVAKVAAPGPYYLVLDNRYANIIDKKVTYQLAVGGRLSDEQIQARKVAFEKVYGGLKRMFIFKDFNITIGPCGQANAFSTTATGDVTICSEILDEMADRPGAMVAVIFHELGHTLLNLWGYPNFANEDDADQFATTILLRSGENGKQALDEWTQWFAGHDSRAQAAHMLTAGDTHSLSIQRIRNIRASMQNSVDMTHRWNNLLYPHMTIDTLKSIVANPALYDDSEFAKIELAKR